MWKRTLAIFSIALFLFMTFPESHATASITLNAGVIVKTKYGQLTVTKNMVMANMAAYANGTIMFNVTGFELVQHVYQFSLKAYGNGTWNIRFWGIIPIQLTANNVNNTSYNFPYEQIQYTTNQNSPLVVVYGLTYPSEPQKLLFIDDFIYTNPLLESKWTIDRYGSAINAGISTSSGYLIMNARAASDFYRAETAHVTDPIYNPTDLNAQTTGTIVKRKMTVTLIPFAKSETQTASVKVGLTVLYPAGTFPGDTPQGTPSYQSCGTPGGLNGAGASYVVIDNDGTVTFTHCYANHTTNLTGVNGGSGGTIDPTLYTVLTIETSGLYCSTCQDKVQPGSSWVYFRIYQRNTAGQFISSTDKNLNLTSNISPLINTNYAFIHQENNDGGATTGQVSKIDLVQVQNYGSPVCLSVPGGTLCTRLPPIPNGLGQGIISDIAWLASQIGFGDEQIGAIIMFLVLSTGFAFVPFILTRNYLIGGTGLLLVFSFFIYAGFLPTWMLFIPILFGGVLGVLLVNRLLGSHSLMGGGGSDTG